jgi:hypothetical protein
MPRFLTWVHAGAAASAQPLRPPRKRRAPSSRETREKPRFDAGHAGCSGGSTEATITMSPFVAAVLACAYMGVVFLIFGRFNRAEKH